jgi:hypothetical protein
MPCDAMLVCPPPHHTSQVLAGTEFASLKPYLHITLVIGEGREAKESNRLPELVAEGKAQRLLLPEPLQLSGQVLAFVTD